MPCHMITAHDYPTYEDFIMKILLISFIFTLVPFLTGCGNSGNSGNSGNTATFANDLDNDGIKDAFDVDDNGDGLIEISSAEQLNNIRYDLFGSSYKIGNSDPGSSLGCGDGCNGYQLINDIDLDPTGSGAKNWDPVGTQFVPFSAIFDGGNYTIRNLIISSASFRVGFIGVMGYQTVGVVKNVHFRGGSVSATTEDVRSSGVVVGNYGKNGTVENVSSDLDVFITGGTAGGLVGTNSGILRASYNTGNVRSDGSFGALGGLVGAIGSATGSIEYSYSTGTVTSASVTSDIGGLAGQSFGRIADCYSTSDLISNALDAARVGGLVGVFGGNYIGRSYFSGTLTGKIGNSGVERIGTIIASDIRNNRSSANEVFYSNYYKHGTITGLDDDDVEYSVNSGGVLGIYESDFLHLTVANTEIDFPDGGWSEMSWDFSDGKYPTLKLHSVDKDGNKIEGPILCGQPDSHTQCEQEDENLS